MKVLPWVGGLRVGYNRQLPGAVDLADIGQRQRIVAECRGLMDEGFDGVHLNVEPVPDGDVDFLALLRALRNAIGGGILSCPRRVRARSHPGGAQFLWTPDYYLRVAAEADQLVVMTYDTALPTPSCTGVISPSGVLHDVEPRAARPGAAADRHPQLRRAGPDAPRGRREPGKRTRGAGGGPPRRRQAGRSRGWRSTRSGRPTKRSGPPTSAGGGTRARSLVAVAQHAAQEAGGGKQH